MLTYFTPLILFKSLIFLWIICRQILAVLSGMFYRIPAYYETPLQFVTWKVQFSTFFVSRPLSMSHVWRQIFPVAFGCGLLEDLGCLRWFSWIRFRIPKGSSYVAWWEVVVPGDSSDFAAQDSYFRCIGFPRYRQSQKQDSAPGISKGRAYPEILSLLACGNICSYHPADLLVQMREKREQWLIQESHFLQRTALVVKSCWCRR